LAILGGHIEVVVILLDFGAQINFYCRTRADRITPKKDIYWWYHRGVDYPPLFTAVKSGNLELVSLLLQRGADPELYAPSPLYRAVKDNRRDIISLLLQYGVGAQDTALKLAVLNKDESMVRYLLNQGFNVSRYAHTGLFIAEQKSYWDIFNLLKSRGATLGALSDTDRLFCAQEDGDGTESLILEPMCVITGDEGVDEPDVESEED
jgi:hypothetical protein